MFREYLVRQLKEGYLNYDLSHYQPLATLVEEETRRWDRQFDHIKRRYKEFAGIEVAKLKGWGHVEHAHQLRNALTHNLGLYTSAYVKTKFSYRPTREDLHGLDPPNNDDRLINRTPIPLSSESIDQLLTYLIEVAGEVRDALQRV